MADKVGHIQN